MQKTIKTTSIILLAALFAICAVMIALVSPIAHADGYTMTPDGNEKKEIFFDRFDGDELKSEWQSHEAETKLDGYALHFGRNFIWGNALVLNAAKMTDYTRITFDMQCTDFFNGDFSVCYGGRNTKDKVPEYDFRVRIDDNNVVCSKPVGNAEEYVGDTENHFSTLVYTTGEKFSVELIHESQSAKTAALTVKIYNKAGSKLVDKTFDGVPYENRNGYVAFFNNNLELDLTNFKFFNDKNSNEPAFADNFAQDDITEAVTPVAMGNWHINTSDQGKSDYYTCKLAALNLSKAGSYALNTLSLTKDLKVTNPHEIAMQVDFNAMSQGLYYGVGFGIKSGSAIDSNGFIGFTQKDNDTATLALIKNGVVADSVDLPLTALNVARRSTDIKFVLKSNNSVTVTIGLNSKNFVGVPTDGMFAVGSVATATGVESGGFLLRRITLIQNKYIDLATEDVSNDFDGVFETDDGYEESYVNNQKYYFGLGVELKPKTAWEDSAGVEFSKTNDLSCFGYRAKYSEFILEFDVVVNTPFADNRFFGISFGKNTISKSIEASQSICFLRDQWNMPRLKDNYFELKNCTDENGAVDIPFAANGFGDFDFYKDTTTKYNLMFVARNRTVAVYFKEDSQPAEELGKCRLLVTDVNTNGFVTVFARGGMSIDVSNFKLVNIAPNANSDSKIALRESFDGQLSQKLTLTGGSVANGKATLNNGKIELKNEGLYYLAELAVSGIGDSFALNFGGYSLCFEPKQNKAVLTGTDFEKTLNSPVGKTSMSALNGKILQVLVQGNKLTVGVRSASDPYDKVYDLIIDETLPTALTKSKLSVTSSGALTVDSFRVYSLDGSYAAQTINFADDPNTASPWVQLPMPPTTNKIDIPLIVGVSAAAVVVVAAAVVVAIVLIKKHGFVAVAAEQPEAAVELSVEEVANQPAAITEQPAEEAASPAETQNQGEGN